MCSLSGAAAQAQLAEWRDAAAALVTAASRPSPGQLVLTLRNDLGQLPGLIGLAQREKACCPFFSFSLAIEADGIALRIRVPPDAAVILDDFAGHLLPAGG